MQPNDAGSVSAGKPTPTDEWALVPMADLIAELGREWAHLDALHTAAMKNAALKRMREMSRVINGRLRGLKFQDLTPEERSYGRD